MKKSFFIAAVAAIFIACEGPEGPPGPRGQQGLPGEGAEWFTTSVTINSGDWMLSGSLGEINSYFYFYKEIPQLTAHIYNYGTVIAYIEASDGVKNGMPYVYHRGDNASGEMWTQTYDIDFMPGEIGFYVSYSDFDTTLRPSTEKFHIVLLWQ